MPDIPSSSNIYPLRECSVQRVPRHVVGIIPVISASGLLFWAGSTKNPTPSHPPPLSLFTSHTSPFSLLSLDSLLTLPLSPSSLLTLLTHHSSHLPLLTPVTGLPSLFPSSLLTLLTTHYSLVTPPPSHSCHWTPFSPSPSSPSSLLTLLNSTHSILNT